SGNNLDLVRVNLLVLRHEHVREPLPCRVVDCVVPVLIPQNRKVVRVGSLIKRPHYSFCSYSWSLIKDSSKEGLQNLIGLSRDSTLYRIRVFPLDNSIQRSVTNVSLCADIEEVALSILSS